MGRENRPSLLEPHGPRGALRLLPPASASSTLLWLQSRAPNNGRARCSAHYGPGGVTAFCSAPGHALVSNPLISGSLPGGNSPTYIPAQAHQRHFLWAGLSANVWRVCLSHFVQLLMLMRGRAARVPLLGRWLAVPGTCISGPTRAPGGSLWGIRSHRKAARCSLPWWGGVSPAEVPGQPQAARLHENI